MQSSVRSTWFDHFVRLVTIAIAIVLLVLAPFWIVQWVREPFLEVFPEPNNVASQINAEPLDPVSVRGREQPVQAYRFMGLK